MKQLKYSLIKSKEQYQKYCEILEELTDKDDSNSLDEIELLSLLIHTYNEEAMEKYQLVLNPVELLVDLLFENGISQNELAKRLNISPQLINDVVKYRRAITKNLAFKLAEEFKVKFAAFLKPYQLKQAS